jgi:glycosyltransferase involved in cell wall biosynthesis
VSEGQSQILLVAFTPFPAPTGAATRLAQRIAALSNAGWSIDVLTPKTAELPHVSRYMSARIFRVPLPSSRDSLPGAAAPVAGAPHSQASQLQRGQAFERAVRRQLQGGNYSLIYLCDPFVWPVVEENRHDTPVLFEPAAGPWLEPGGDSQWVSAWYDREALLIAASDAVIVPTNEAARRASALGARSERVHVLRPCVDVNLFRLPGDGRVQRNPPVRIAVAAASMRPQELSLLAEMLLLLPPSLNVRVTISTQITAETRSRLLGEDAFRDRLSLSEPVLYDDLAPFYQEADIGLVVSSGRNPGRSDGVRLQTVAEMMACGLVTILPDVPPIRELVAHDREAFLVRPGDVEALVNAIELLAKDQLRRRRLGLAARARAVESLDEAQQALRLAAIVKQLAGEEPVRGDGDDEVEDVGPVSGHSISRASPNTTAETVPGRASARISSAPTAPPPVRRQRAAEASADDTAPEVRLPATALSEARRPVESTQSSESARSSSQ